MLNHCCVTCWDDLIHIHIRIWVFFFSWLLMEWCELCCLRILVVGLMCFCVFPNLIFHFLLSAHPHKRCDFSLFFNRPFNDRPTPDLWAPNMPLIGPRWHVDSSFNVFVSCYNMSAYVWLCNWPLMDFKGFLFFFFHFLLITRFLHGQ